MTKLFDQDFFKLLIGFLIILLLSFGVFYFVAQVSASHTADTNTQAETQAGTLDITN